ncbi:hypothetical protein FOZ60_006547 [Perkinsus olseni]|uniref:F-box domain-containing protein n=1 Tax=Perkinsus olseni TaxID=32597 RepID=A0A7J6NPL4_PEROL|nr:hypothetical protein FOZ60_006547 [Perkinsus olseni]
MAAVIGVAALSEEVFSMITLFLNAEEALALSYTCIHCYICLSRDNSALWRRYLETGTHRVRPQAGTTCTKALSVEPSNFRLVVAVLARSDWRYRKGKIAKFLEGGEAIRRFYPTGCRKDTLLRVDPVCLKEFSAKQRTQSSSHRRLAFSKGSCGVASANASILTRLVVRGDEGSLRRTLKRTGTQLSTRDRVRAIEGALGAERVTTEMAACVGTVVSSSRQLFSRGLKDENEYEKYRTCTNWVLLGHQSC